MRLAPVLTAVCAAVVSLVLAGCGTGGYVSGGSQSSGKELYTSACGGCHTLAAAGTNGAVGPNLDDAFAQSREAGMTSATFAQVVSQQIRYPVTNPSTGVPGMPGPDQTLPDCGSVEGGAFCVDDQSRAIEDIAAYVGEVAGTGITAEKPTDGKSIFASNCGSCHTLADAGTNGGVGPNLDDSMPSAELVNDRVTNGKGQMPSFKDSLDQAQIDTVADYVSSVAGK